jgi:YD repeat-containing protein
MNRTLIIIILMVFFSGLQVSAQKVHLKTGNFSVKHTDMILNLGYKIQVTRVYNSSTDYKGIFGAGWSFEYSKSLLVNPDGSIVTKECECEGRTNNVFKPTSFDETAKSASIQKITEVVQAMQSMNTEDLFAYKKKLIEDRGFFIDEWKRLIDLGKLQPYQVPFGTKLVSKNFRYEVITRTSDGYELVNGNTTRYYNVKGLPVKIISGRDVVTISYDQQDQLTEIRDQLKNVLSFSYVNGLVSKVRSSGAVSETIEYQYSGDKLASVQKGKKPYYSYVYAGRDKKLSSFKEPDEDFTRIYYENDKEAKTKALVKKYGDSTIYSYEKKQLENGDRILTGSSAVYRSSSDEDEEDEEKTKASPASLVPSSKKEMSYYISNMEDGFHYNYRTISKDKGIEEDTYNNEEGYPDKIIKNNDLITTFKYNAYGEVIFKDNKRKTEEVQYDPVHGKILEYKHLDKELDVRKWSKFRYKENGDLVYAENSEGKKVELKYDEKGLITWIKDVENNKELFFTYNEFNKPIEIREPNLGAINVKYSKGGEIEKVDGGDGGHKLALEVTQLFQNLLSVVKVENMKPCKCSN